MPKYLLALFFLPLSVFSQGDLGISPSFGINSMTYSLENSKGSQFTFDNKINYSLSIWADYGLSEKLMLRGRVAYNRYSLTAIDTFGIRQTDHLKYVETGIIGLYRPKAEYGLYLGGGPVGWWSLGKDLGYFDEINEEDLQHVFGLEFIMGYLFRTEGFKAGLELYIDFPLNPAMEYTTGETTVKLNASRVAGIRIFIQFMVKE